MAREADDGRSVFVEVTLAQAERLGAINRELAGDVVRHPFADLIVEVACGIERVVQVEHPRIDVGERHQSPLPRSWVGALSGARPRRAAGAAGATSASPCAACR